MNLSLDNTFGQSSVIHFINSFEFTGHIPVVCNNQHGTFTFLSYLLKQRQNFICTLEIKVACRFISKNK